MNMSEVAVCVEGLGKEYQVRGPRERCDTLRDQLNRLASNSVRSVRGRGRTSEQSPPFWALKDVSFEVRPGEVVGIIGRNGAGKSTLLKILSRITEPTEGEVGIEGRVGSLLEVGTGFHPELTGRENVYLNGAILGMRKADIARRFEEIIAFAEVEKFVDTPVKHYSSGMYMRLAFAIAAHLEPDILIVDEVLAVGDAEFQKRCIGKMGEVAKGGRTVLFVSHNIGLVLALCDSGLYLKGGRLAAGGSIADVFAAYSAEMRQTNDRLENSSQVRSGAKLRLRSVWLHAGGEATTEFDQRKPLYVRVEFDVLEPGEAYTINVAVHHFSHGCLFATTTYDASPANMLKRRWERGRYWAEVQLPVEMLRGGEYWLKVGATIPCWEVLDMFPHEVRFTLHETVSPMVQSGEPRDGAVVPVLPWEIKAVSSS
jgi:lipopolysaccharide transport system ATP-binding protein